MANESRNRQEGSDSGTSSTGTLFDRRNMFIVVLIGLLAWFGSAVVGLERYRYASMLAECGLASNQLEHSQQQVCLTNPPTLRKSALWDLYYGLSEY